MPIHDWTRVSAGIFHHFHHEWISAISKALNQQLRGSEYYALAEQIAGDKIPDILTLQVPSPATFPSRTPEFPHAPSKSKSGGVALATRPPKTRFHVKDTPWWYTTKTKSVTIRHVSEHRVVAVLEIVSPGNKASRSAMTASIQKAQDLMSSGIHLSLVDLIPTTPRDPEGLHPLVWDQADTDSFRFDPEQPLTCASYVGGYSAQAFVEPVAIGDTLPDLPVFLTLEEYVDAPLEVTYLEAFDAVPDYWQDVLANPGG